MAEKKITTRIVLTHDEYANLAPKTLKEGEAILAKVGTTQAPGEVAQPIWMMKIGDGTSTVENCPWLVAPAADVYDWAKKSSLDANDLPAIPGAKLGITVTVTGDGNAVTDGSWDATTKTLTLTKGATFATKAEFDEHNHKASELDDFATDVTAVINGLGITTDGIEDLSERLTQTESDIDALEETVQDLDNNRLVGISATGYEGVTVIPAGTLSTINLSAIDTDVKAAQADASAAKTAIEAFLDENAATDDVVNTLKEIQAGLDAGEASAASLLAEVNKIKDGTTVVPKATDADTVDGKHADDFAEAGHNHDDAYSKLNHTHTVADITDYDADVKARIKGETDARTEAVEDLQGQIDNVKATADTALQSITTTANGGLKVTGTNQIDIDDDIIFVLDGGTAADLT